MRYTLRLMIAGAALPLVAAAQVQPTPPTPPAQPTQPSVPMLKFELQFEPMFEQKFELEQMSERMKFDAQDLRRQVEELAHVDVQQLKFEAEEMRLHAREMASVDFSRMKAQVEQLKFDGLLNLPRDLGVFQPGPSFDKLLNARPREPWAQEDPADSLYRSAREALNRGEYRRAAQLFSEVTKKFPKSKYAQDCAYWEAFSRYRIGTDDDLKQALKMLEVIDVDALMRVGRETSIDIPSLRARILGALAARGDRDAAAKLQSAASQNSGCDREEVSVRAEALSALGQMDLAAAMPLVKKVLLRRDECTVELRRRALYLIGRQGSTDAVPLILDVAKNDTDQGIRSEAMRWLPRVAGDNAVPMLEDLLRTSTDEQTQRSAINALASIDTERARKAIRAIIERNDAAERVRYDAIISLSRERDGRSLSADDMGYLRGLYGKLETPRLREAVLTSISRVATPENEQFLLALARNQNEPSSLRAAALQRLGRMSSVSLDDIAKVYDVADARSLREQILQALYQRKEPEAVDKMIEIAKKDTDPQIRRTAISLLARSDNPRAKKWLQEIIDK
jgi:HEAT repeat protein/TolA-binding protein